MKSRVAVSLTFHRDATIDWEPAWLKAAARVTSAAPGTCSPRAVSHPDRIASAFGARLSPAMSPTVSRWLASSSPAKRRYERSGRSGFRTPCVARWMSPNWETNPINRALVASCPSRAVTEDRIRASSRTSRLAAGRLPSGFATSSRDAFGAGRP